jgi:fumarate hydratase subunit alpha
MFLQLTQEAFIVSSLTEIDCMISEVEFRRTIFEMLRRAATILPRDVIEALEKCRRRERDKVAILQFACMLKNLELARKLNAPICQDTGIPIFFIKLGNDLDLDFDPIAGLRKAVKEATLSIPLRANLVDPLSRVNTKTNVGDGMPAVHMDLVRGKRLQIDLLVKGAGAENWSRLYMLRPSEGELIERAILLTIGEAGGQPCPPTVVGVGIGGAAEVACLLAKRALLRPLDERNKDRQLAKLEHRFTRAANELGIGPMGLGGRATVLGVHIEKAPCHTASLPVAINLQCWAARRASAKLVGNHMRLEAP